MATPQNGQTYANDSCVMNCLNVFDHFVGLAIKELNKSEAESCKFVYEDLLQDTSQ